MTKVMMVLLAVACCVTAALGQQYTPIVLGNGLASVNLPPEFIFVDAKQARKYLEEEGSSTEGVLGIFAPAQESQDDYFVICRFEDVGYVTDDDSEKLDANQILSDYKEGTQEQNEERAKLNLPPIYVGQWAELPHYNSGAHEVIWAIEVKEEDSDSAPVTSINYNTRILGRRGVLSMNLVTDPKDLAVNQYKVASLLQATTFNRGETYAEYVPGHDKSAGYGIAGLILGGGAVAAAAKFGLFGALWKWALGIALVMKKFALVAFAGIAALSVKLVKIIRRQLGHVDGDLDPTQPR
jgi:uncharacterized membrane-anchored protein